jgi:hypothetical protein
MTGRPNPILRPGEVDADLETLSGVPWFNRDENAVFSRLVDFGIGPTGMSRNT